MKSIVLIDGEHYPPVIARAVEKLIAGGESPVLALMVGGGEKLGQTQMRLPIPVESSGGDTEAALAAAIERTGAGIVIDLSDEPVLGYVERCRLASVALWKGAVYKGADFEFTPPGRPHKATVPSVAVFGTGKRSGKTAIAGTAARIFREEGLRPVVVAMGRGGPAEPDTLPGQVNLTPQTLYDFVKQGRHAASDYIEDALTAGVPTVGAWRAGGGLAGGTAFGNYGTALDSAEHLGPRILLLEGSGSALPPAKSDAGVFVVDARIDPAHLCGYFGLYRLLLADLIVLTMCEETVGSGHISAVEQCIRSCTLNQPTIVRTVFRPHPLGKIEGKRVWFATTASAQATEVLTQHLTKNHESEVVGVSHALADRGRLVEDLRSAHVADVLLVELKAAAVDVATRYGIENGMEVVYLDNRPHPVGGTQKSLEQELLKVAEVARQRFTQGPLKSSGGAGKSPLTNGNTNLE